MIKLLGMLVLGTTLIGCESLYNNDGIARITSQRQVDAYNATVSSEGEKLVCTNEKSTTSNIRRFNCMTVAQRERMALESQREIQEVNRITGRTAN